MDVCLAIAVSLLREVQGCHPLILCRVISAPLLLYIRPIFLLLKPISGPFSRRVKEAHRARGKANSFRNGGFHSFCLQGDPAIQEWKPWPLECLVPRVPLGFLHEALWRFGSVPGNGPQVPPHDFIIFTQTCLQHPGDRVVPSPVAPSLSTDQSTSSRMMYP